jgi:TPR repeat protein
MRKSTLTLLWLCFMLSPFPALAAKEADELYEKAVRMHGTASTEEIFSLYARAAEAGHAAAQYNVAMMYANGETVNVDYQQSAYWFQKSSNQNFAPAKFRLGEMYFFGMGGLQRDVERAQGLFQHGAELGDVDAQMNYAIMRAGARGEESAGDEALYWMEQAQQGGHESAERYIAMLQTNPEKQLTPDQRGVYWTQQRNYWIEMAAVFGVREAEEAVVESSTLDEAGPQ